ncbi:MAG: ABC transporter permease [Acidobacteriota bacterium]
MKSFYSFYTDATKIALQSIFAHKLRAFLTLIGIIIGVASVVVVGAAISGLKTYVLDKVSKVLGANHFMIARMVTHGRVSDDEWERMDKRNKRLTFEDFEWLQQQCTFCAAVGAQVNDRVDLKINGQELFGTQVAGVTANMGEIEDKTVVEGRFLVPHEIDHASYVVVIGYDLKDKFFEGTDPIGKELKVRDIPLTVVGVEEKRGSMFGQSLDNHLYIPITTFGRLFGRRQSLQLHGKAENRESFEKTIEQARVALRNYHKLKGNEDDDFGLVNVEQFTETADQFTGAIAIVITPITMISLLVGGIVVMNIMLVSVTERTFEIGLRKALGATRNQILTQFMIESSLLTSFGGVLGLLLASGISSLISSTTPMTMTITVFYIALSLGVSTIIGLIAGIYPAFKAAKLDPIKALTKN